MSSPARPDAAEAITTNFPSFRDTLILLKRRGIPARKMSLHQVTIGPMNYYPAKGTIFIDGTNSPFEKVVVVGLEGARAGSLTQLWRIF